MRRAIEWVVDFLNRLLVFMCVVVVVGVLMLIYAAEKIEERLGR